VVPVRLNDPVLWRRSGLGNWLAALSEITVKNPVPPTRRYFCRQLVGADNPKRNWIRAAAGFDAAITAEEFF
jgi:hypothetical protein